MGRKKKVVSNGESPETRPSGSLREDFNRRFLKISNGREKTVVALMFGCMVVGLGLVLYSRHLKQQEPQPPLLEILKKDTRMGRDAIPFSITKPSGTPLDLLKEYEAMLTEYELLLKMDDVDTLELRKIEHELNKMLQDVKN